MASEIVIPAAALEAGAEVVRAYRKAGAKSEVIARAAFVAMVKAWEGMFENPAGDYLMLRRNAIILPLAQKQEDGDDC